MSKTIPVVRTLPELRSRVAGWRRAGERVALVPTMGALHEGHLSLVRLGQQTCRRTIASIFVNPRQFAPTEDLAKYPRDEAGDLAKLATVDCDLVWAPTTDVMYPPGYSTRVEPGTAAEGLETEFRPHFFSGVATVCCKLFTQVGPDVAVFGEKDYQQLQVVTQMVRDLNLALEIVPAPTMREEDGLAMSSRNRYLSAEERGKAVLVVQTMRQVAKDLAAGETIAAARSTGKRTLAAAGYKVDYVEVRDTLTLRAFPSGKVEGSGRILVAAWLGRTRLIDNMAV